MSLHQALRSTSAVVILLTLAVAGCGATTTNQTTAQDPTASAAPTTTPGTVPVLVPDCPGLAPDAKSRSAPAEPPTTHGPISPNLGQVSGAQRPRPNPPPVMFEVINGYALYKAGDEYVDTWLDPTQPDDPIVVAFTDHIDQHRAALLASRPSASDPPVTGQALDRSGSMPPNTRLTNTTTLAESGWPIQVIQLNDPASRFRGLRTRAILFGHTLPSELDFVASNNVNQDNRLEIGLSTITDDVRQALSNRLGADKICLRVIKVGRAVTS